MVSVTITFEIFKLRYYVYCALFDLSCKLLLSIYLISAMCYTYYSTYYSSIFCLIYYRVVVKINLYQCQCQCQCLVGFSGRKDAMIEFDNSYIADNIGNTE